MSTKMIHNSNDSSDRSDGSSSLETSPPPEEDLLPPRMPQDAMMNNGSSKGTSSPSASEGEPQHHATDHNGVESQHLQQQQTQPPSTSTTYADAVMNGIHDPMTNLAVESPASNKMGHHRQILPQIQEQQQQGSSQPVVPPPPIPPYQQQNQHPQFSAQIQPTMGMANSNVNNHNSLSSSSSQTGGENTSEGEGRQRGLSQMSIDRSNTPGSMSVDMMSVGIRANTPGAMSLSEVETDGMMVQEDEGGQQGSGGDSNGVALVNNQKDASISGEAVVTHDVSQGQSPTNGISNNNHTGETIVATSATAAAAPSTPPTNSSIILMGNEATAAHERSQQQLGTQQQLTPKTSHTTFKTTNKRSSSASFSKQYLRAPEHTLERLSYILGRGSLVMINFSQRNLGCNDAELIRSAILSNPQLSVLKLGYNNLGDIGANLIASAIHCGGSNTGVVGAVGSKGNLDSLGANENMQGGSDQKMMDPQQSSQQQHQQHRHHPSLSVLDLGFNNIGDEGCTSLATMAVARNPALSTLYLSGNAVRERGALSLAEVIAGGCGLTSLHLTANRVGPRGVKGLMRSMAEFDVTMQMAHQDRENRMALEEERRKRKQQQQLQQQQEQLMTQRGPGSSDKHPSRTSVSESGNEEDDVDLESLGINDDENNDNDGDNEEPDDLARLRGYQCMEELYLGGTHMESTGCLSVSNMLLTNLSLRVICLSDNGLNDQDLSLFSQSLSRNRELPLETLRLSFNRLTCVGVETLMNAIWGSKTLREIKLDNNQIRDRGAQLAAVVLTSVDLEVLDMGFNRLTIVGIKALMKSLAENRTLLTLTLSGNVLDTNASKAVSYALAYNKTIRKLYVDHCSLSYAAQRHIAAGIVSNSHLALRVMSGFPLGAISVTLGLPGAMETWSNEQVLKFIRVMWDRHRHEKEAALFKLSSRDSNQSMSTAGSRTVSSTEGGGGSVNNNPATGTSLGAASKSDKSAAETKAEPKSGPSDPATVVAAAKSAFEALGDAGGALLLTEEPQRAISDSSPMVSSDAVMLEKTPSGTIRVPSLDDSDEDESSTASCRKADRVKQNVRLDLSVPHSSTDSLCTANGTASPETPVDPAAKRRTMEWLRLHFRSLNEMTQLPYVYADLLQLYRYFYSPAMVDGNADNGGSGDSGDNPVSSCVHDGSGGSTIMPPPPGLGFNPGISNNNSTSTQQHHNPTSSNFVHQTKPTINKLSSLQRKISYRGLHDMMMVQQHNNVPSPNFSIENSSKRRPVVFDPSMQPETKRARSGKPRIDYFPRLKSKIEQYLSSSKQTKALVLLRQLKFVETTMFHGTNPYCDQSLSQSATSAASSTYSNNLNPAKCLNNSNEPIATDAEVILIDML